MSYENNADVPDRDLGPPPAILRTSVPTAGNPEGPAIRVRDLLLVVAFTAILLLLVRLGVREQARSTEFVLFLLALQSAIPLAAIYAVIIRGRGLAWADVGLRPVGARWIAGAVVLGLGSLPLLGLINFLVQMLAGGEARNPQIEILAPIAMSWQGLLGLVILAGVVGPIMEEIVFRGVFYGWLRARWGAPVGVTVSAAAFAAAHGIPLLLPALFVQGALFALVYERSGSLWPPIVMHGVFNVAMSLLLFGALAAGVTLA
jgi:uncharacterized protein